MGWLLMKKMFRDMRRSKTTYFLCILIAAVGFCGYSVLELCYENLSQSRDLFFYQSDFCDAFVESQASPSAQAGVLEQLPGIAEADSRLVKDVQASKILGASMEEPLDLTGEEAQLHLVSWSAGQMNRPVLSQGELPREGRRELVIGEGMAKARNLSPGDRIYVVIGGKEIPMEITGIGMSPENIYMIRDMSEMFPTPATYDAAFTTRSAMEKLFGMQGRANSFLLRLDAGADWNQVKDRIEQVMDPYGMTAHYLKEDQIGISMVGEEIKQLKRMSGVVPFLFLTVAGVILYISLSRMVEQQRTQIGTMMALGIPKRQIQLHFMGYGAVTGVIGGLAGGILGYLLAGPMADFYRVYFNLPDITAPLSAGYLFQGIFFSAVFCAGTAGLIAGRLGKLEPADAMHPAAPKAAGKFVLEKIPGFSRLFSVPGLMAIRSLNRNRKRTAFAVIGMAFAFMITATLVSMNAMFDVFIFDFWEDTQRQDITVTFDSPVAARDALEAVRHPGAERTEGMLEFPATLYGPEGKMDCSVQAISPRSELMRLYRKDGTRVYTDREGIVITEHMAQVLGVGTGGRLEVKVSYPTEKISQVTVSGVAAQYMGGSGYMSYGGAAKISDYRNAYNSVLIKAPGPVLEELRGRLDGAKSVSSVQSRENRVDQYHALMGSMSAMMASMAAMGVLISLAVIYVSSLISFEELKRELSTLMMLGLKGGECLDVISTGQWILAAGAVLLGIPMAMGASRLMSVSMASDLYTIPDFINGKALLESTALMALAVFAATALIRRKLEKLVPVDLLRERE